MGGYPVLMGTKIITNSSQYAQVDSILRVLAWSGVSSSS